MSVPASTPISPAMFATLDMLKAGTAAGKLATGSAHENPTPIQSATKFAGVVALGQGTTGALTHAFKTYAPTVAASYPHQMLVVNTLKGSIGALPAAVTMMAGIKNNDKTAVAIGAGGIVASSGFMRVAENAVERSASSAVKAGPPMFKAMVAGAGILYGVATIASNYTTPPAPKRE